MESFERIDRNIDRCVNIIEQLFAFSQTNEVALGPVSVDAWLQEVVGELDLAHSVQVTLRLASEATVAMDPEQMQTAVTRVIQNACQAMAKDERTQPRGELVVETARDANQVVIRISDDGEGIAGDAADHVLEPLFSTRAFGIGLGLPLVKQIVERHGGSIDIDSTEGQGTTVTLRLAVL